MTATFITVVSAVAALISAIGAVSVVLRERHKPTLDKTQDEKYRAEIKRMSDETNAKRDYRIWQLEGYIDLDRGWHRDVIGLFEQLAAVLQQLQDAGLIPADMNIPDVTFPPPPSVPEPPRATP